MWFLFSPVDVYCIMSADISGSSRKMEKITEKKFSLHSIPHKVLIKTFMVTKYCEMTITHDMLM